MASQIPVDKAAPLNPDGGALPVLVHVTAPADLPAGYTFTAEVNENPQQAFTVEVPSGGVKEGQVFLAPLPDNVSGEHLNVPTGRWKDGLFDCCSLGFFHPHMWCAFCCPQILMAQVMMRTQLDWLGEPGPLVSTKNTFKVCLILIVSYLIYSTALEIAAAPYDLGRVPAILTTFRMFGFIIFNVWALYALCKTRENIRARYSIEEKNCQGCEDLCCSFFCTYCVTAQLARHTGEYETYRGTCFTQTGHPPGTPLVV